VIISVRDFAFLERSRPFFSEPHFALKLAWILGEKIQGALPSMVIAPQLPYLGAHPDFFIQLKHEMKFPACSENLGANALIKQKPYAF